MDAQELILKALDQRYQKYVAERKRCREDFSEEAVHDLRIASRRLLALVDLLRAVAPQLNLKNLRAIFKDQLDSLDGLRDTQVMLAEFTETVENLPDLAPLLKFLKKREHRLLEAAEREVHAFKLNSIARQIENVRIHLAALNVEQDLSPRILPALDETRLKVSQRLQAVDPSQPFTIHRVRIAFKKFRYMLEIAAPILPAFPEEQFKAMHDYQAAMGEIQDVEVMLRTLADYADGHHGYDPQPVRQFYEARHSESINSFVEDMQEFVTFWRTTPVEAFPWESQKKELS